MVQRIFAIIGYPIGQVRSPEVFNTRLKAAGSNNLMVPLEVAPEDFASAVAGLRVMVNFAGLVVTVPHKIRAAELAIRSSARVRAAGAANLLRPISGGWEAELTDGIGFVAGLLAEGHAVAGQRVAIVGAGGAGLAIAEALLAAGAEVAITDVNPARCEAAGQRLSGLGRFRIAAPSRNDGIVVNATPLGMAAGDPIPVDLDAIGPEALVAEAIMKPAMTPLLEQAERRGHRTHAGRHMLDGQVPAIWDFLGMPDGRAG
ncbi:shikimate dehydrogenase family protein [Pelagibacterium montanilacus]|uniref:shikimate dehydrogenase family protein n=1 Tax=Pelagibacterium montanilacus TaxID=2185280 RepID=UPI000F8F6A8D|nr:3-hydroxyacyl-CoA dehydrogenase NAD-binding domain-containing protein [Pelagibacterium montanilacus]